MSQRYLKLTSCAADVHLCERQRLVIVDAKQELVAHRYDMDGCCCTGDNCEARRGEGGGKKKRRKRQRALVLVVDDSDEGRSENLCGACQTELVVGAARGLPDHASWNEDLRLLRSTVEIE